MLNVIRETLEKTRDLYDIIISSKIVGESGLYHISKSRKLLEYFGYQEKYDGLANKWSSYKNNFKQQNPRLTKVISKIYDVTASLLHFVTGATCCRIIFLASSGLLFLTPVAPVVAISIAVASASAVVIGFAFDVLRYNKIKNLFLEKQLLTEVSELKEKYQNLIQNNQALKKFFQNLFGKPPEVGNISKNDGQHEKSGIVSRSPLWLRSLFHTIKDNISEGAIYVTLGVLSGNPVTMIFSASHFLFGHSSSISDRFYDEKAKDKLRAEISKLKENLPSYNNLHELENICVKEKIQLAIVEEIVRDEKALNAISTRNGFKYASDKAIKLHEEIKENTPKVESKTLLGKIKELFSHMGDVVVKGTKKPMTMNQYIDLKYISPKQYATDINREKTVNLHQDPSKNLQNIASENINPISDNNFPARLSGEYSSKALLKSSSRERF